MDYNDNNGIDDKKRDRFCRVHMTIRIDCLIGSGCLCCEYECSCAR